MSTADALVKAIQDRINAGQSKETIKAETLAAGHKEEIFEAAYLLASQSDTEAVLPAVIDLWKGGYTFLRREWRFAVLFSLPFLMFALVDAIAYMQAYTADLSVVSMVAGLLATISYAILFAMLIRIITQNSQVIDYKDARQWLRQNWAGLLWVYVLSFFIIIGGLFFFLIPGLIIGLLLSFSWFSYIDGYRGEAALQRSRAMVRGQFWTVVFKLLGVWAINIVIIISLTIVGEIVIALAGGVAEGVVSVLVLLLTQLLGAVVSIISMQASYTLYAALKDTNAPVTTSGPWLYRVLAVIGLVITLMFAAALFYLFSTEEGAKWLEDSAQIESNFQAELRGVGLVATAYRLTNNQSFEGVCDAILVETVSGENVACNDTESAWALSVEEGATQWCVDSTGYNKTLAVSLEERTECLPF